MAISSVGTASATAGSGTIATSAVATLPSGLAANDLLIVAVHRTHDYALTSATPTGYTFVRNILDTGTTPNAAQTDIYYRICDGAETTTGPTFTTGTGTRWIIHAGAYRGGNTSSPFLVENGQAHTAASSTSHDAPAITNTDPTAWGVYVGMFRGSPAPMSWTAPTGLTERLDTDLGVGNTSNLAAEWADSAGVVATGAATYTGTSSVAVPTATAWAAFLRPLTPGLSAPTGLAATAISTSAIDVTWNPVTGATGYDVERDSVVIASDFTGTTYHDLGLSPATLYSYRVRAVA